MFVSVNARVRTDNTGAYTDVPVLLTQLGVLEPLLEYCLARSHDRSQAWMSKLVHAVTLFLKYLQSNPKEDGTYRLFQNFAQRLYTGTFDIQTGLDPSGLCWKPKSVQSAGEIISQLTDFFDWLGKTRPQAAAINPSYAGGSYDRATDEAAYRYRREKAFLGHTWAANARATETGHLVRAKGTPIVATTEPPRFPDDRFDELLYKGFLVGGEYDYRGMLITLLMHGAGFRVSEPFHLYVGDVFPDPSNTHSATVLIHHPSHGDAPRNWTDVRGRKRNRSMYLAEEFALVPRTETRKSWRAGWKKPRLDAEWYMQAYWFKPEYGELFLTLWNKYLQQVVRLDRNHPFAWVNLDREPRGNMYCIDKFNKAHAAACERIGLKVAKELGTTPHGHRHAYGKRLESAKVGRLVIQRCMHHASPNSQDVYTQADSRETHAALQSGALRLQNSLNTSPPESVLIGLGNLHSE